MKEKCTSCKQFQLNGVCEHGGNLSSTHNHIEEIKKEILGWMNYGIPRGKTVPIFEDLIEKMVAQAIQKERERLKTAMHYALDDENHERLTNALQALSPHTTDVSKTCCEKCNHVHLDHDMETLNKTGREAYIQTNFCKDKDCPCHTTDVCNTPN